MSTKVIPALAPMFPPEVEAYPRHSGYLAASPLPETERGYARA